MVLHTECVGYKCHFHRPTPHDQYPWFTFPKKSDEHITTTPAHVITETVTSLVTDILKPSTTPNSFTSGGATISNIGTTGKITEATTGFKEVLTEAIETTSAAVTKTVPETITHAIQVATETIGDTTRTINETITDIFVTSTNNFGNNDNKGIIEGALPSSLSDVLDTATDSDQIVTKLPDITKSIGNDMLSQVYSTTEEIVKSVTDQLNEHDENNHSGIYAILGIILVVLLLIIALGIAIYIKYRKNQSHTLHHPYYEVSDRKDTTTITLENEEAKECVNINDTYIKYST